MSGKFRRFEFVDDKSSKFWEVRTEGSATEVRYGRIGTSGQLQRKEYETTEAAKLAEEKLIKEKTRSGYTEHPGPSETVATGPESNASVDPKVTKKSKVQGDQGQPKPNKSPNVDPNGKTLCISGKLPSGKKKADYESALSAIGIKLVDDVSSSLTYLVVADPHVSTGKAQKARMLDIPIMSEDDLTAMLKK
jgi:predicted DNA-binding WGR domain protein